MPATVRETIPAPIESAESGRSQAIARDVDASGTHPTSGLPTVDDFFEMSLDTSASRRSMATSGG